MNTDDNHIMPIWDTAAWPKFTCDLDALQAPLSALMLEVGKIAALQDSLSLDDRHAALANEIGREAVASYAIEGETLELQSITISVMASLDQRYRHHVDNRSPNIATLMLDARQRQSALTKERLFSWHRMMFQDSNLKEVGQWRTQDMRIVSGPMGNYTTEYVAPPPSRVRSEMERFIEWLNKDTGEAAPIKAAIAHVWYESIHPFEDGNGRTGRLIIEYLLAQVSERPLPLSPSRAILKHRKTYYAELKRSQHATGEDDQQIDITDFVRWLLTVLKEAAEEALLDLQFLSQRNLFMQQWSGHLSDRQTLVIQRLFEEGRKRVNQGISSKPYARIAKVSAATASRDLADLLKKGAILQNEAKGRSTSYRLNLEGSPRSISA